MEKRKVCLFGLSADPPTNHQGHVGIIHALMQRNEWDEIWILPVYRHTYEVRSGFFLDGEWPLTTITYSAQAQALGVV